MSDRESENKRTNFKAAINVIGFDLLEYDLKVETIDPQKRNGLTSAVVRRGCGIVYDAMTVRPSEAEEGMKFARSSYADLIMAAFWRSVPDDHTRLTYDLECNEIMFRFTNEKGKPQIKDLQTKLAAFAGAISESLEENRLVEPYIILKNTVSFPEDGIREPAFVIRCWGRYWGSLLRVDDEHLAELTERNYRLLQKNPLLRDAAAREALKYCPEPSNISVIDSEEPSYARMVQERQGKGWAASK